jgi:hypothetical protein
VVGLAVWSEPCPDSLISQINGNLRGKNARPGRIEPTHPDYSLDINNLESEFPMHWNREFGPNTRESHFPDPLSNRERFLPVFPYP